MKLIKSIMAGMFIGLSSFVFLSVGSYFGAVLFTFGLICIVLLKLDLFTNVAGSTRVFPVNIFPGDLRKLGFVLFGNMIGTLLVSFLFLTRPDLNESVRIILQNRLNCSCGEAILKGLGCGFIMEAIFSIYKKTDNKLAILFGIPIFIILGFYHCITDSFYIFSYLLTSFYIPLKILLVYILTILGNFLGCIISNKLIKWS